MVDILNWLVGNHMFKTYGDGTSMSNFASTSHMVDYSNYPSKRPQTVGGGKGGETSGGDDDDDDTQMRE